MIKSTQVLLVILLATTTFSQLDPFDPGYTYYDYNRTYPQPYTGADWDLHEAAFNKTYAELVKLRNEGKPVEINDKVAWTDEEKAGN